MCESDHYKTNGICHARRFHTVEFLIFSAYENPLLLREVHMIDGTMLDGTMIRRSSTE